MFVDVSKVLSARKASATAGRVCGFRVLFAWDSLKKGPFDWRK